MTQEEFDYLRDMLKVRSGLVLGDEKRYLLESRLMPVARELGLESLSGLVSMLKTDTDDVLRTKVTQAMTINESFFFRDKTPFDNFTNIMLPAILASSKAASRSMKIWCAAASTGQEPYSLAILIKEMGAKLAGWNIEIIATDLSEEVLEKAKAGLYSQFEVQRGLPVQLMVKYFEQTGSMWQIDSAIRSMVTYKHFNLLEDYTPLGTFDIVFCRNVLIYFDPPTKSDMLGRMAKRMRPDSFLVLGAAETVIGISEEFKPVADTRGLYSIQTGAAATSPAASRLAASPAAPPPAPSALKTATATAPATAAATGLSKPLAASALSSSLTKPATPAAAASLAKPATPAAVTPSATPAASATASSPLKTASATAPAAGLTKPLAASALSSSLAKPATPAAATLSTTPPAPAPLVKPAAPASLAKPAAPAPSTTPAAPPPASTSTTLGVTPRADTAKLA